MEKHDAAFAAAHLDGPVYAPAQALLVLWPKRLAIAGLVSTWSGTRVCTAGKLAPSLLEPVWMKPVSKPHRACSLLYEKAQNDATRVLIAVHAQHTVPSDLRSDVGRPTASPDASQL